MANCIQCGRVVGFNSTSTGLCGPCQQGGAIRLIGSMTYWPQGVLDPHPSVPARLTPVGEGTKSGSAAESLSSLRQQLIAVTARETALRQEVAELRRDADGWRKESDFWERKVHVAQADLTARREERDVCLCERNSTNNPACPHHGESDPPRHLLTREPSSTPELESRSVSAGAAVSVATDAEADTAAEAHLTALTAERDEYRTLAAIGTWHKDCRPNRQQAARELQKSQAVIDKLADTISQQNADLTALREALTRLAERIACMGISWNSEAGHEVDGEPLRLWSNPDGDPLEHHPWITGQLLARKKAAEMVRQAALTPGGTAP